MTIITLFRSMLGRWGPSHSQDDSNRVVSLGAINSTIANSTTQHIGFQPSGQTQTQTQHNNVSAASLTDEDRCNMEKRPMQYAGYPLFTKYLASSQEAMILRRFDQLHARVLLKMQDDIVRKEEEIERIDQAHSTFSDPSGPYHINGSFRKDAEKSGRPPNDQFLRRSTLLSELKEDIRHYDQMILNYRKLRSDPEPSRQCVENVRTYLYNWGHSTDPGKRNLGPLWQEESEYIYKDGDLVELVPETKARLRRWIEAWGSFMLGPWFRNRPTGTQFYQDFRSTNEVMYQSDTRIEGFITGLSLLCGLLLLIGPLQLLNRLDSEKTKLNVICGLITAFLIVMAFIMPAKPWETLAATAAYSAVLMVFVQISH